MTTNQIKALFKTELINLYPIEEIESFFNLLIEHYLGLKRIDLALNPNKVINKKHLSIIKNALDKLKKETPIQYIIGHSEFYGLIFKVNEHVLIPRQETEELITWIIHSIEENNLGSSNIKILDIGTGSGCIPISLAKNLMNSEISAIDISKEALTIAQNNAISNNTEITFLNRDILKTDDLKTNYDIIVSNPPYVRELEKREIKNNVLHNEPHLALFVDDNNPLLFYSKIADLAKESLSKNGLLFFEINQYLGTETVELLQKKGYQSIELRKDIFGNDRMIKATL